MPRPMVAALTVAAMTALICLADCGLSRSAGERKEGLMEGATLMVKGKKLFYVERGAGHPVVLVHGNTGSSRWWSRVMDVSGARCLALDLPNFGRSDRLEPDEAVGSSDIDVYADYLIAFVEALRPTLGPDRPLLVGHSLGGAVAISALCRRPELWVGAVLVDSAPPSGLVTPEAHYAVIERFKSDRALLRSALASVCPTMHDSAILDELTNDALLMNPESFAGNARALARFDRSGECGAFGGPVHVVWGRKDAIVTEAMARTTAAAFDRGSLEILENVGHSAMIEDSAAFRDILARAVRQAYPAY